MITTTATIPVPPSHIEDGRPTGPEVTAIFTAADGTDMPVRIKLFQIGPVFGVGVYPTATRGAVLRWHDGPAGDPVTIHWTAPASGKSCE